MNDVMLSLDKLNQGAAVTTSDAAILSRSTTPPVVKAAVLARLLHRPATHIETQLCTQLATELPDGTATLRAAFPEHCSALPAESVDPHPFATRMLRADWTDRAARRADLRTFLDEYVHERLPSDLVAAWLGTVMERGLSPECLHDLTHAMKDSGRMYDYRGAAPLAGRKLVRRYPTGGLSEKTALILPSVLVKAATKYPIASNFLVARSLGFTGGTWDKLSAIPGFRFPQPGDESIEVMARCGVAMTVTHGDLNPADRKLYQLRSVTGTIESHELIVASIASKPSRGWDFTMKSFVRVVLRRADGRFLVLREPGCPFWNFPGGKVEPNEKPAEAAARELREETSIKAPVTSLELIAHGEYDVLGTPWEGFFFFAHEAMGECVPERADPAVEWSWVTVPEMRLLDSLPGLLAEVAEMIELRATVTRRSRETSNDL